MSRGRGANPNGFFGGRRQMQRGEEQQGRRESSAGEFKALSDKLDEMFELLVDHGRAIQTIQAETSGTREALKALELKVSSLENKVAQLEESSKETASTASTIRPTRSFVLPPELSAMVKALHKESEGGLKFDGSQKYGSDHNKRVATYLKEQIDAAETGENYSGKQIKQAVYRYYDSRRKKYLQSQSEELRVRAEESKKKHRRKTSQQRIYDQRKKAVQPDEREKWKTLNVLCMSEESEGEEDGKKVIVLHSPQWLSKDAKDFLQTLQTRVEAQREGRNIQQLARVRGPPRQSQPPQELAAWVIAHEFRSREDDSTATESPLLVEGDDYTGLSDPEDNQSLDDSFRAAYSQRMLEFDDTTAN